MWRCPRRVSTVVCVHEPHCQPPNCSGHGTCVDGRCECTSRFWRGAACNELDCGPSNCSQHGLCTETGCRCDAGWMGSNCSEGEHSSDLQKLLERVAWRHAAVAMPSSLLLAWKSPSEPLLTSHANLFMSSLNLLKNSHQVGGWISTLSTQFQRPTAKNKVWSGHSPEGDPPKSLTP